MQTRQEAGGGGGGGGGGDSLLSFGRKPRPTLATFLKRVNPLPQGLYLPLREHQRMGYFSYGHAVKKSYTTLFLKKIALKPMGVGTRSQQSRHDP